MLRIDIQKSTRSWWSLNPQKISLVLSDGSKVDVREDVDTGLLILEGGSCLLTLVADPSPHRIYIKVEKGA